MLNVKNKNFLLYELTTIQHQLFLMIVFKMFKFMQIVSNQNITSILYSYIYVHIYFDTNGDKHVSVAETRRRDVFRNAILSMKKKFIL